MEIQKGIETTGRGGLAPMKILFMMRYYSYIAHYEEALRLLARQGHQIQFSFDNRHRKPFDAVRMKDLFDIPGSAYDFFPDTARAGYWAPLADFFRRWIDYLRYLHPDFAAAVKVRKRAARRVHPLICRLSGALIRAAPARVWIRLLKGADQALPVSAPAIRYLKQHRPDLVLFTPLVDSNAGFIDFARAAQVLGIPAVNCVASWDNLTNKGLIQAGTDAVLVWNEFQKEEAIRYHEIPESRVRVTGAQTFDKWFEKLPSLPRAGFAEKAGLRGFERFVVYVCSSRFIARHEPEFIRVWAEAFRRRAALSGVGVIVRPHPANLHDWSASRVTGVPGVVVFPDWKGIPYPFTEEDKQDYFHTLHHASAIVGINTSALIEAGIQGTPAFTILDPQFRETQDGVLHFDLIRRHGLLSVGDGIEAHLDQLEEVLDGRRDVKASLHAFIGAFVRPHGRELPASPRVVRELEGLLGQECRPSPALSPVTVLLRLLLCFPAAGVHGYLSARAFYHWLRGTTPGKKTRASAVLSPSDSAAAAMGKDGEPDEIPAAAKAEAGGKDVSHRLRRLEKALSAAERDVLRLERFQKRQTPFLSEEGDAADVSPEAAADFLQEYRHLLDERRRHLVAVNQPLVLISQIHRSGGTLLSQLFDGHPALHAHPHELMIGYPAKTNWPRLDLNDSPAEWFRRLYEPANGELFRAGFTKGRGTSTEGKEFPFLMPPLLLNDLFRTALPSTVTKSRDILDAYMTAYFNGWLDNQHLYGRSPAWITAFVPRLSLDPGNLEAFFADYPDGRLIQILREPASWYASASRHGRAPEKISFQELMSSWKASAASMLQARARYGQKVLALRFEELITRTPGVMAEVCAFLKIDFHPVLLEPTFNGFPIKASSSFPVAESGMIHDPVNRGVLLSPEIREAVRRETQDLYERACIELFGMTTEADLHES